VRSFLFKYKNYKRLVTRAPVCRVTLGCVLTKMEQQEWESKRDARSSTKPA